MENINCLLFIAIVINPRFKLQYVKYCFRCAYDVETAPKLILKVEQILQHLFAFYHGGESIQNNIDVESEKGESSTPSKSRGTPKKKILLSQFLK